MFELFNHNKKEEIELKTQFIYKTFQENKTSNRILAPGLPFPALVNITENQESEMRINNLICLGALYNFYL